jgi:hypothetical protein
MLMWFEGVVPTREPSRGLRSAALNLAGWNGRHATSRADNSALPYRG